jgi:hypothetical protein
VNERGLGEMWHFSFDKMAWNPRWWVDAEPSVRWVDDLAISGGRGSILSNPGRSRGASCAEREHARRRRPRSERKEPSVHIHFAL